MTQHASGPFEVKLAPQKADNQQAEGAGHGRMSMEKQLHGDLEATSQGEMLSYVTNTKGSAAYVAIEKVTGTLGGRKGSFVLQHNATMNRGTAQHHRRTRLRFGRARRALGQREDHHRTGREALLRDGLHARRCGLTAFHRKAPATPKKVPRRADPRTSDAKCTPR